jgi:nicotinate-nucleotide pyrophosphorylase (carboxylating)
VLREAGESPADAERLARLALEEDGPLDITTQVAVPSAATGRATLQFRQAGVLAGVEYADAVNRLAGCRPIQWHRAEGQSLQPGDSLGVLEGPLPPMLRAERPLLNLLQRASGIATLTHRYVEAVAGTPCRVLHTRKTAPGLREFDIRAVLAGGGARHRSDLAHEVLVKDNHWRALTAAGRTLPEVLAQARTRGVTVCGVEVESVAQLQAACAAGATRILIDNQSPETVRDWAALARRLSPLIQVEASGGITLENVRRYAEAGADFVSVGLLTHSAPAADIALEMD